MRLHRALALSAVAAFSLTVVTGAAAAPQQTLPVRTVAAKEKPVVKQKSLTATLIAETTVQTWTCQDKLVKLGVLDARSKFQSAWSLPKSEKYRKWVLKQRIGKQADCLKRLHADDDTIRRLQRGLTGTPMSGSEAALLAAGRRYGISPYFIAGIAGTESSFGAAACSNNRYNAFGLSSCGSGWHVPNFQSWGEAYLFMAKFLTDRWPSASSTYSYGGYAACSSCWGAKTAQHMSNRFGVSSSVRFP